MAGKMSTNAEGRRPRRKFTPEYKAEVVRLVRETGRTPFAVARELGLTASAVSQWVRQAEVDARGGGAGALTTEERQELVTLRREIKMLRQEREVLKRAAAFFAKESTS
jgi:transposase